MWILRWIGGTILVLLIIGFAIQNTDVSVVVKFYKWQSVDLPLWVVMYLCFATGVLAWLVISIVRVVMLKKEIRKTRKDNKRLRDELNRLRNVAIEDEGAAEPTLLSPPSDEEPRQAADESEEKAEEPL